MASQPKPNGITHKHVPLSLRPNHWQSAQIVKDRVIPPGKKTERSVWEASVLVTHFASLFEHRCFLHHHFFVILHQDGYHRRCLSWTPGNPFVTFCSGIMKISFATQCKCLCCYSAWMSQDNFSVLHSISPKYTFLSLPTDDTAKLKLTGKTYTCISTVTEFCILSLKYLFSFLAFCTS